MDLERYICDNTIGINSEEWCNLNSKYSKEELITGISDLIMSGEISLPLRRLTLCDAKDSFQKLLGYRCNDFYHGNIFTRYEYEYPLSDKWINESNIGNIASDYFQQENRYNCDSINAPSPVRVWSTSNFNKSMLNGLWSLKYDHVDESVLRSLLSIRKYVASQYKPTVAKSIFEKFNSKDILDFSAGWGDRLCGFYATENTRSYIGIDPNTKVYGQYFEQIEYYEKWLCSSKNVRLINSPAEDVILENEIVDTVFTSPPYFNVERYCKEPTQSVWRYRKLEDWLSKFLFMSLDNAWDALKHGGNMIINISNVYSGHKINNIVDPMCEHIEEIGGKFVEGFGMALSKRPNSGALKNKDGQFVEPIWVFTKR